MKSYLEEKIIADKIETNKQKNEKLDDYLIDLEEYISRQGTELVESGIKTLMDSVYAKRFDGKLRYQDGESCRGVILSITFKYPTEYTYKTVAQEIFALPKLNIWQQIQRVFKEEFMDYSQAQELFDLPKLNTWQRVIKVLEEEFMESMGYSFTEKVVYQEDSLKIVSLKKIFKQLEKMAFCPIVRLVYCSENTAKIQLSVAYTKGKQYFH